MQKSKDPFAPPAGFGGPYANPAGLSRPHGFGNVPKSGGGGSPAPAIPFYPQVNALFNEQVQANLRGGTSMRSRMTNKPVEQTPPQQPQPAMVTRMGTSSVSMTQPQSYQQSSQQQMQLPIPPQRQFGNPAMNNPFAPPLGFERQTAVRPPETFAKDYYGQSAPASSTQQQSQVNYVQQHQQQLQQQQQFMQQQQQQQQQQYQQQQQQQQRPQQQFAPQPSQQQQLPNGKTRFHLLIYDLSRGVMAQTSMTILGAKIEAVYHCGIEAYGNEYWYGPGGIQASPANSFGPQNDMRPLEIIPCETSKQKSEFQAWLRSKQGNIHTTKTHSSLLLLHPRSNTYIHTYNQNKLLSPYHTPSFPYIHSIHPFLFFLFVTQGYMDKSITIWPKTIATILPTQPLVFLPMV